MIRRRVYTGRIAVIIASGVMLFIVALSLYAWVSVRQSLGSIGGRAQMSVMVADSSQIDPLTSRRWIEQIAGVQSVQYIDSTEAQDEFSHYLSFDITTALGPGVIPSSYLVGVAVDGQGGGLDQIKRQIESASWVQSVSYEQQIVEQIGRQASYLTLFCQRFLYVVCLVALVVLFVLSRLSVGVWVNTLHGGGRIGQLRGAILRRGWVNGVLISVVGSSLFVLSIVGGRVLFPELSLSFNSVAAICAATSIFGSISSFVFTYLSSLQLLSR